MNKGFYLALLMSWLTLNTGFCQNWIWARSAIAQPRTSVVPIAMESDLQGNVYVTGTYSGSSLQFDAVTLHNSSSNSSPVNFFLVKFNPSGHVIWARGCGTTDLVNVKSLVCDASGSVFVAGNFTSASLSFGKDTLYSTHPGSNNLFIAHFDSSGVELWSRSASCPSSNSCEHLKTDALGNLLISGSFSNTLTWGAAQVTSPPVSAFFYGKLNPAGNILWLRFANAEGNHNLDCSGMDSDKSGALYISGSFNSDSLFMGKLKLANPFTTAIGTAQVFFAKCDSSGKPVWLKLAAGSMYSSYTSGPIADFSGHVYLAGTFDDTLSIGTQTLYDSTSGGDNNIFISSWDSAGNLNWVRQASGVYGSNVYKLLLDADQDPVLTGAFNSPSLSMGSIVLQNDSAGSFDFYLAKYHNDGTLLWAKAAGGNQDDIAFTACKDPSGNICVAGYFESDTLSFGATQLTSSASNGYANFFLVKLATILGIPVLNHESGKSRVYPNPMELAARIEWDDVPGERTEFILYNTEGAIVRHASVFEDAFYEVQRETLPAGIYFYRLNNAQKSEVFSGKLIIE